ncbi:conjugal transfer mating pair stabilization protein TraN [Pseudomonas sp. MAG002Y]|uniref:conjugal transfer mating pair stabilization protein TraN n=1 Tax=Pseudomonas sp. MAG002Y TaxID=2678690 RepID=UPI001C60FC6A|nr:conjugal transfer mating pair stabilization protein TraN [Pseudomonas sp. MAG002Y]MBW5414830.1 conjugal transfer mating pair stabilization protein TraN [Pseudomonas sp. MAG002Y]
MNRTGLLYRTTALAMTGLMLWLPIDQKHAQAADMAAVGKAAQEFGKEITPNPSDLATYSEDGTLTLPGANTSLNVNELFPGGTGDEVNKYFPHAADPTDLQQLYDDGDAMNSAGTEALSTLRSEQDSGEVSLQGQAFEVVQGARAVGKMDLTNDPMMKQTNQLYTATDSADGLFPDCDDGTDPTASTNKFQQCTRPNMPNGQCEADHDYTVGVIEHHAGPANLNSCGAGCMQLWIGEVGDNYWSGNCSIKEQYTEVTVINPEAVISAQLEYAKWDDYMQVWVGPAGQEKLIWQGPNNNFPPETAGACELNKSWTANPLVDVTSLFKNVKAGATVRFKIRVSVTGEGEGYGRIRLNYDSTKAVKDNGWDPADCLARTKEATKYYSDVSYSCTEMPALDSAGCMTQNGVRVCESDFPSTGLSGISPMCRSMTATIDASKSIDGYEDTCTPLADNPQCGLVKSVCSEATETGECIRFTETYDCGAATSSIACKLKVDLAEAFPGCIDHPESCQRSVSCMGAECIGITREVSQDFDKAASLLQAAQFMGEDLACAEADATTNVECEIFKAEPGECKKAIGGSVDCCEQPTNVSVGDYLALVLAVPKIDSALMSIKSHSALGSIQSSYAALRNPVVNTFQPITKPFTSFYDGIIGLKDKAIETVQKQLASQLDKLFVNAMGTAAEQGGTGAAGAAAGEATDIVLGDTAGGQIVQGASSALGFLMTVYTYYVVAMIIIEMIWECEKEEFELNAQRELGNCHKVGKYCKTKVAGLCIEERESYCCFNSPLSRIIQEQARPQLGKNWGDAEEPECGGLTIDEIGQLNWDTIDLTEWVNLLNLHNLYPTTENVTLETLTGQGSLLNTDQLRENSVDRTVRATNEVDLKGAAKRATDAMAAPGGLQN